MPEGTFQEAGSSFKRKLSKREKKQIKKQEKLSRIKSSGGGVSPEENDSGVAEKLYTGINNNTMIDIYLSNVNVI